MLAFFNLRLQILLKLHGIPCQFGAIPELGYQNASFVLKTFLQVRREKGYDTWVVFVELVKVHDSIQHKVIKEVLENFGVPSDLVGWAMKLCTNFEVEAKVGKHKSRFRRGCGVREGGSLAPALLTLVAQLAVEELVV